MSWNDRTNWPARCEQALTALEARKIKTPGHVAAAVKALRQIESQQPSTPSPTALREAYQRGADPAEVERILLLDMGTTRLKSEWAQAKMDAAGTALAALRDSVDEVMAPLRGQADAAIEKLRRVADFGGASLDSLVREGRHDDARLLADVDLVAADYDACADLRDRFLVRGGGLKLAVGGVNCSRWRDPIAAAAHARGATPAEQYVAGLHAGLELWFPSPDEAVAAASAIADNRAEERQRKADSEFGVGSVVFLGA